MFYKTTLALSLASFLLTGCGSNNDQTIKKQESYEKSYYENIDYSDIEKISAMLLDKDPRFKDLKTQIPLAKLSVQVMDQNLSFDTIDIGMDEDNNVIKSAQSGNYTYVQFEDQNATIIILINNKGTEDESDDEQLNVRFDGSNTTKSGSGDLSITRYESENFKVTFPNAVIANGTASIEYNTTSNQVLIYDGALGVQVFNKMIDISQNYPNIDTVVLKNIEGSVHDSINMQTGFLIRKMHFNTFVADTEDVGNSDIASGGVDLFCAGVKRSIENSQTVKLGIHSWSGEDTNGTKMEGRDFPKNHKRHHDQLLYFSTMLGIENGYAFYFHTLEAATGDNIHLMSNQEIATYQLLTQ